MPYAEENMLKQYLIDQVWSFHIKKWLKNGMVLLYKSEYEAKYPQIEEGTISRTQWL